MIDEIASHCSVLERFWNKWLSNQFSTTAIQQW